MKTFRKTDNKIDIGNCSLKGLWDLNFFKRDFDFSPSIHYLIQIKRYGFVEL